MEDNAGRGSNDSWFGRRRKCLERSRRKRARSECEEEEQERQEGEQTGGAAEEVREEQSQLLDAVTRPADDGLYSSGTEPLRKTELGKFRESFCTAVENISQHPHF